MAAISTTSLPAPVSEALFPNGIIIDHAPPELPPHRNASSVFAASPSFVSGVDMSHNHPSTVPTIALLHSGSHRSVHGDDAGGADEEQDSRFTEYASQDAGEQGGKSSREGEAGEVTVVNVEAVPVYAAKGDAAHDDHQVNQEQGEEVEEVVEKRRPGRPKKKSTDGVVEEEVKTTKRARPKAEKKEVTLFAADRPTRERKSIDRFIASAEKEKTKELQIKQGGGTPLKDIPNVVYKLSKRSKHDEALSQLHSVLFNKRGKAAVLKQHILQFSGYVWGENQYKERAKVQEKLERYTKESLVQFVDVLDIHVSRILKKEDLVAKVLEFLEKPCRTTDTLLELKDQEGRSSGKRSLSGKRPGRPKIRRVEGKVARRQGIKKASEDGGSDDESLEEEIEQKRLNFKDDTDHDEESVEVEKRQQDTEGKVAEGGGDQEDEGEFIVSRKKLNVEAHDIMLSTPSESADRVYSKKLKEESTKSVSSFAPLKKGSGRPRKSLKTSGIKDAKSANSDKEMRKRCFDKEGTVLQKKIPSDGELREKIRQLLKEADFSKVTFTDVVSQLEGIFEVTLVEQKGHVKGLIRDEISKLTEVGDESEDEGAAIEIAKDE